MEPTKDYYYQRKMIPWTPADRHLKPDQKPRIKFFLQNTWRRSEAGASGVESVEGLQSLHHPGQGTDLGLSVGL